MLWFSFLLTKMTLRTPSGWKKIITNVQYYIIKILQINLNNFVQNSSTCFQMFHKVGFYIESLVASSTFKQLALVVGLHVGPQVGSVRKFLPTVGTAKWFLPCVGPHVSLQQPGSRESLATHVTLVAEAVGEDVHGEGR